MEADINSEALAEDAPERAPIPRLVEREATSAGDGALAPELLHSLRGPVLAVELERAARLHHRLLLERDPALGDKSSEMSAELEGLFGSPFRRDFENA